MKAMILAAGLGSRLQHKTEKIPKALVQVAGRPILHYQLTAIANNGINEVVIVIGYEGQKIIDYVTESFPNLTCHFVENSIYDQSNSSYSFWLAKDLITDDSYLHFNCDIIMSEQLVKEILESDRSNVFAVGKWVELRNNMEQVELDGDRILKMDNQHYPEAVGKAFGFAKFSKESTAWVCDRLRTYIDAGDKNQNYYGMLRQAIHELPYFSLDASNELLLEVNTLDDLALAEQAIARWNSENVV